MRTAKLLVIPFIVLSFLLVNGCCPGMEDLRLQNDRQQNTINSLNSQLDALQLEYNLLSEQLQKAQSGDSIEAQALQEELEALKSLMAEKDQMIEQMQAQLLTSTVLPPVLTDMLEQFANANSMVSFDADRGIVKFESDLLFEKGSDQVTRTAATAIKSLCSILATEQAKEFDILIAGHTDDLPVGYPETLAKHPTNWHLSVHRAISVLNVMKADGIDETRMSVRGFGEFRPVEPNAPDKQGNPKNRRVEIFIIAKGA